MKTTLSSSLLVCVPLAFAMPACSGKLDVGSNGSSAGSVPPDGGESDSSSRAPDASTTVKPAACNALGAAAETLVQGGGAFASNGTSIFYVDGVDGKEHELVQVPVGVGSSVRRLSKRTYPEGMMHVAADATWAAYALSVYVPNEESGATETHGVVAIDLATGAETAIAQPTPDTQAIGQVIVRDGAVVFSTFAPGSDGTLVRWDGASAKPIGSIAYGDPWTVDSAHVYVLEGGASSPTGRPTTLKKTPLAGGASTTLKTFAAPTETAGVALVGVRDGRIYYRPLEGGVASMNLDGEDLRVDLSPDGVPAGVLIGAEHFFTVPFSRSAIHRTAKTGGVLEVFAQEPEGQIQSVTIDECNVYWRTASPAVIKGKRQG